MNWDESRRGRTAPPDRVLDLVVNSRYFAPAILAREEAYQQFRDEAALDRLLRQADGADRPSSLLEALRHRLGGLLIILGTNLRGAYTVEPDIPTTSGAAASGAAASGAAASGAAASGAAASGAAASGAAASGVLTQKQQLLRELSVS